MGMQVTQTEYRQYTESWLRHVRSLAVDIGPRGSATEGERRGAEYCQRALNQAGLSGRKEAFVSARSIYHLLTCVFPLF